MSFKLGTFESNNALIRANKRCQAIALDLMRLRVEEGNPIELSTAPAHESTADFGTCGNTPLNNDHK